MKKILKFIKADSGEVVLFVIFIILFFMLFIGTFLSRMILRQIKVSNNVANSVQAYYIADSGTEMTLYYVKVYAPANVTGFSLNSSPAPDLNGWIANPFAPDGTYNASVETAAGNLKIEILGAYKQTSRAIELSWN
jgi:hypothetical protein